MPVAPPKKALSFLRWFLREDYLEEIEGDLTELFRSQYKNNPLKARWKFTWSVLRYFRPGFIKSFKHCTYSFDMISDYLKISWRSLLKQKMYSAIKVGGFSLGIATCFLITLYIRDEVSYDRHYPDAERIYRVVGVFNQNGEIIKDVWFPAPFAKTIKQDYEEIKNAGRFITSELFGAGSVQLRPVDHTENFYEENFAFIDQSMLDMLQLPFIYGSRQHALTNPNSIVITRSKAEKYYPGENPVGKLIIVNNDESHPYTIGGVVEDFPSNTHLRFDFMATLSGKEFWKGEQDWWGASNYPTYILLSPGVNRDQFSKKVTHQVIEKYVLPSMLADRKQTEKELREMLRNATLEFQPIHSIYLDADVRDSHSHSDIRFLWLFGTIAVFILVIACINFINLSTAKSANRAKEVGIKKVMGSLRFGLIKQFLTESMLFTFLAVILGIFLAWALLPYFNILASKTITFPWFSWWLLPLMLITTLIIGLLAGLYPAFYLSSFRPIQVLKGSLSLGSRSSTLRNSLVVFQFATSVILIASTLTVNDQMKFILNKKVGFEKDQVLVLQGTESMGNHLQAFKNELKNMPGIKSVSLSDYLPVRSTKRNGNTFWVAGEEKGRGVTGQIWRVDADYIATLGMELIDGRDFDPLAADDSEAMIINEKMAAALGLKNPVGERVVNWQGYTVIGVVKDFHFESLKNNIEPLCLVLGDQSDLISVKVSGSEMQHVLASVSALWKKFLPHQPVRYSFLDERYAMMYDDVKRMGRIFSSFAVFAILVACLGLFALAAFMAEQRRKEISIRLVLGASSRSIIGLLTSHFVKLVLFSILLAVPFAWYLMRVWLQDYAFHIEPGWETFTIAGIAALAIALVTVSYQSIRTALMNPVESLKSE